MFPLNMQRDEPILSQTETDMQDIFKYDRVVLKQKRNRKQHSSPELIVQ